MKLGVSTCLLGKKCRYDGGHKRYRFVTDILSEYFEFVPFCPEEDIFGTPREPIRLVKKDEKICVHRVKTKTDVTQELSQISKSLAFDIDEKTLCGFILKSKSPTCGLERVKVYKDSGMPLDSDGVGLFAKELVERFPNLPMEEEGRLEDEWLRENFLMQVFAYKDMAEFLSTNPNFKALVEFHSFYKYLLYAKSHVSYKRLGNIVANHEKKSFAGVLEEYKKFFLEAIAQKGTKANTYNVLVHMYGYFKKEIQGSEKEEILESLREFKEGIIPLITVVKLIKIYAKRFGLEYILNQKFLNPYPKKLALRSHIKAYK